MLHCGCTVLHSSVCNIAVTALGPALVIARASLIYHLMAVIVYVNLFMVI